MTSPSYMIINKKDNSINAFKLANYIRNNGFSCLLYPSDHKLKKQMKYANENNIPKVLFIDKDFNENMSIECKDMNNGIQKIILLKDL
jgi:histidyl-tRNA synthetase